MIESHIYVILTCDNCGATFEHEEYDREKCTDAEEVAIKKSEWTVTKSSISSDDVHLCTGCEMTR
jgi:hypothetical protein